MITKRTISAYLLLGLFTVVLAHNSWYHTHHATHEMEQQERLPTDDETRHIPESGGLWDWLHALLGGMEHPEMHEGHFEFFIHAAHPSLVSANATFLFPPVIALLTSSDGLFFKKGNSQALVRPFYERIPPDSPLLQSCGCRAPPVFS